MWALWVGIALLTISPGAQSASLSGFLNADEAAKLRILNDTGLARSGVQVNEVIALVRAGIRDRSPEVRAAALGAVQARVMVSRWAGTTGPMLGPGPGPRQEPRVIPLEWKGDQTVLRGALQGECITLLGTDVDDRVRYEALLALGLMETPSDPHEPMSNAFVDLLIDLYRHEPLQRIRAKVVQVLRAIPNNTPGVRSVLRDALVDPDAEVRHEGLAGITPQAVGGWPKLTLNEARDAIDHALKQKDAGVRLGAVQALNVFEASSAEYLSLLRHLSDQDPDAKVRASARLAIEAIERAMRRQGAHSSEPRNGRPNQALHPTPAWCQEPTRVNAGR